MKEKITYLIPSKGVVIKRKVKKMAKAKLGSGERFKAGVTKIMEKEHLSKKSAGAIMATAGRKAHGAKQMAKWSAAGRKRSS